MITGPLLSKVPTDRRTWLKRSLYASVAGVAGYATIFERENLQVEKAERFVKGPAFSHLDGLKIAVLADFHYDDFGDAGLVRRAVRKTNELGPDVVILPGDFISRDWQVTTELAEILADLRASRGIFGMLGNHDFSAGAKKLTQTLEDAGIRMLRGEITEFDDFAVAGLDSLMRANPDPAVIGNTNLPVLLGWHEPDSFDLVRRADNLLLQVSGHTHGGQVCAPGFGPIYLPPYGRKYVEGLYDSNGSALFVTRGVGAMGIPVRFACPPEVSLITIRAQS
ncbi:MAG: metallophosphoesterase [Verrucomicrobiales bacterium]|nr:metallophosphoesterase [Verrucomicrobiales bacterium]